MNLKTIVVGAAALVALVAAPASADVRSFTDAKSDGAGGADIRRVTVTHEKRVHVKLKLDDIVPSFKSDAGASIYLDTDSTKNGPEFVLSTPLFEGSDYAMFRVKDWKSVGNPITCFHIVRLDFDADTARASFARNCLGKPEAVRVAVKTVASVDGHRSTDWLGGRRHLTAKVAQG